jgi:hypothetical protein
MPENFYQRAAASAKHVEVTSMRVALEPLLHLERQALHPAPHVRMPGRNPHPNSGRKRDHRADNALMIAVANSVGAVAAMRTRMSRPR